MDGPVKRKVIPRADTRPPSRSDSNTPTPFSNVTVRAKISSSSVPKGASFPNRSPPYTSPSPRARSPLRPQAPRPVSMVVPEIPTDTPNSPSNLGFVPKAKKSTISLNKNSTAPIPPSTNTRAVLKVAQSVQDLSSIVPDNISSLVRIRAQGGSLTPTGHPKNGRRRAGSNSDDGRSSNLSSNMSSNLSMPSASSTPLSSSPPGTHLPDITSAYRSSAIIGAASGLHSSSSSTAIRVRAKLSGMATPLSSPSPSSNSLSHNNSNPNRHSRSNSVSVSPRHPDSTANLPSLHRRTPSAAFRSPVPRVSSSTSSSTSPLTQSPPRSPDSSPRPRARTVISFSNLHNPTFASINGALRSPVNSTLSSGSAGGPRAFGSGSDLSARTSMDVDTGATSDGSPRTAYFVATVTPDTYESSSPGVDASPVEIEGDGDGEDSFQDARDAEYEAKFNRKIADLEITNRSLLAINAMLETDKLRQSREIRDLRRRLRESRLSLPPAAYKALAGRKIADSPTGGAIGDAADPLGDDPSFEDEDEDEEDENQPPDPTYERVTALIDALIFRAKNAVQTTVLSSGPAPFKVLSPAEVELQYGSALSGRGGDEQGLEGRGAVEESKSEHQLLHDDITFDDDDNDERDSSQESDADVDGEHPSLPLYSTLASGEDAIAASSFTMNISNPEPPPSPLEGSDQT